MSDLEFEVITFEDQRNGDLIDFDMFDERDFKFLDPDIGIG